MTTERANEIRNEIANRSELAARSEREWEKETPGTRNEQSVYRAGMLYAYRDVERILGPTETP